jgi:hypothetical protein
LDQDRNLAALQAQIAADEEELQELARLRAARRIRIEEWLPQRDIIEARIALAETELRKVPLVGVLKDISGTRADVEAAWESWTMERRRSVLKAAISRLVIHQTSKRGAGLDEDRVELEFASYRPTPLFSPEEMEQIAKGEMKVISTESIETSLAAGDISPTATLAPAGSPGFWPNFANEQDNGTLLDQVAQAMDEKPDS